MSRLLESSLTGKISNILVESDIQGQMLSKELEREVPCLQKLIYKDGLELKYALDGDLDKECEKKIYAIAKSRGFDCDIEIDGYYVFITCSESNVNECDEPKEVKPIEKTRDELIRDHGTDDVDLINAGKEPEESMILEAAMSNLKENDTKGLDMVLDESKNANSSVYWQRILDKILVARRDLSVEEYRGLINKLFNFCKDSLREFKKDRMNEAAELEERVALKESLFDEIADFMRDLDPYGYNDAYEGDDAEKHKQAVADIENDKETVKSFLQGIVDYEESTPDMIERAKYFLGALNESVEEPTAEDLEKEDEESKAHDKKAIEDRIGELRAAIADGVSDDEKEAMEKEIAELESHLEESSKLNEDSYEEPFFAEIEDALVNAGFDVRRYTDAGMMTNNLGWVISNSEGEVQLTCAGTYLSEGTLKESANGTSLSKIEELASYLNSFVNYMKEHNVEEVKLDYSHLAGDCLSVAGEGYLPLSSDFDPDYMDDEYMQEYIAEGSLKESVSVATSDGSTVDTQDAASVQSNDGSVTVVTGDTTVVINNNPVEPALDIPQEEPVEEVPAEEIVPEEPIENEVPVEDEVIEESDDEYGIDANVDAKSLSVIKNQGITYMLQIEETSGKTTYWVCDNFNAETNEGDNADVFSDKESADKEYFDRVGLETPSEE